MEKKVAYPLPKVDYKRRRPSKTIPDQSLSIQEIVKRYVRGIPVDVVQREAVYIDQSDEDLEKLSRMDFHEKSEYAKVMAERAQAMRESMSETVRRSQEEREKDQTPKEPKAAKPKPAKPANPAPPGAEA